MVVLSMQDSSRRIGRCAEIKGLAHCYCKPAPSYLPGQLVYLPTHNNKLATRIIGLFLTEKVINPSVQLTLSESMKIHPTLCVSQLKPVSTSSLSPPSEPPPLPWLINYHPAFLVYCLV